MTRINTNVSSLTAQKTLQRSNASLQQALTRLSTGLRINVGKDDPAGLIASEALRSDINSTTRAIANTQRANEMIATADSALSQVSSLLNDIRGLVTEAANTGAMSTDQIAANQLQVDSSLEALNRISQTVAFQGRRLLDGSLDFVTENWTNQDKVSDLQVNIANLGTAASMGVEVVVGTAATQGALKVEIGTTIGGTEAFKQITFGDTGKLTVTAPVDGTEYNDVWVKFVEGAVPQGTPTAAYDSGSKELTITVNSGLSTSLASIKTAIELATDFTANVDVAGSYDPTVDSGTDEEATGTITFSDGTIISLTANAAGPASDANIVFTEDSGGAGVVIDPLALGEQNIKLAAAGNTAQEIVDAFNNDGDSEFTAVLVHDGGTGYDPDVDNGVGVAAARAELASKVTGGGHLTFTALDAGAAGDSITVQIVADLGGVGAAPTVAIAGNAITIHVDDNEATTLGDIVDAVNNKAGITVDVFADDRNATFTPPGDPVWGPTSLTGGLDAERATNTATAGGFTGINDQTAGGAGGNTGGLTADLVFQLSGFSGTQIFSFETGATGAQLKAAINLVSDATGIGADFAGGNLTLESTEYGSSAFVDVGVVTEGALGVFGSGLQTIGGVAANRNVGADVIAKVNGVSATGRGNTLSINNSTLSLSMTVAAEFAGTIEFDITSGGAQFQLGPDVVSNQQARIGIMDVNSASLSGATGRLYTLASGGDNDLSSDPTTAAKIVDEVINKVTTLRGRLGAFQKATLESNIVSLTDTIENLTAAESAIRDADFASESAALTRAQILVQSGVSVLAVANQNPQNVLALLR